MIKRCTSARSGSRLTRLIKHLLTILSCLVASSSLLSQSLNAIHWVDLAFEVEESSGLVAVNGELFTHNDSGGEPALYSIDPQSGQVLRQVWIANAQNVDWEDVCADDLYVYIGDIGNNNGNRQDLVIYKIAKADMLTSDTVQSEKIEFTYADQTSYASNPLTNYDAEGLIALNGTLYLFTKNRGNLQCNVYAIPSVAGQFVVPIIDQISSQGLITAATTAADGSLFLLGVDFNGPFLMYWPSASNPTFSDKPHQRINLQSTQVVQMEALWHDGTTLWMSTETEGGRPAALYQLGSGLSLQPTSSGMNTTVVFHQVHQQFYLSNPTGNKLKIEVWDMGGASILSMVGEEREMTLDAFDWTSGTYLMRIETEGIRQEVYKVVKP